MPMMLDKLFSLCTHCLPIILDYLNFEFFFRVYFGEVRFQELGEGELHSWFVHDMNKQAINERILC